MKLTQKKASKSHRVLLFGPPKSGKTFLAGKTSEKFKLIWVDIENGVDTLLTLPEEWKDRIEVISLPDTRSFPVAIETCLKLVRGTKGSVCDTHGKWECPICKKSGDSFVSVEFNALPLDTIVVFDSLTQLTQSAIAHITKNQPDDYKLTYDDWGNLGKLMDTFLSHIQQAPYNVICITHETETEMEDGKIKLVPTAGTRAFSRNTAKYFDEVVYCDVKNKRHLAASSTTYANNILTGSRSGSVLENQTNSSLIGIFEGVTQTTNEQVKDSPGEKALTGLAAIKAKLENKS